MMKTKRKAPTGNKRQAKTNKNSIAWHEQLVIALLIVEAIALPIMRNYGWCIR